MSIFAATAAMGRSWAEARMTDACTIGTRVRSETMDETTGEYTWVTTVTYEGICEMQFSGNQVDRADAQSQVLVVQGSTVKLPVATSGGVRPDDVGVITASATDPSMVGVEFRVEGLNLKTYTTARRFPVEVVTSG